jgi:hypothetical protein
MPTEASKHPSIRAYQQNQRAHYEGQVEQLRELERFEQTDAALQVHAVIERARMAKRLLEESESDGYEPGSLVFFIYSAVFAGAAIGALFARYKGWL